MSLELGELEFYGPFLGGVVLHGAVDFLTPPKLLCYIPALVPLKGLQLKAGFILASLFHIASDTNAAVSIIIHVFLLVFEFLKAREGATAVMLGYMWMVHLPIMLYRTILSGEMASFAVISTSIAVGSYQGTALLNRLHLLKHDKKEKTIKIVLPPLAQRIVICHVVANLPLT